MRTTKPVGSQPIIEWRGVLSGAALAAAFLLVAGTLGAIVRIPAASLLIAAAAFLGVGMLTRRLRPGTNALSPALGAALATAALSLFPIVLSAETTERLTRGEIAISVIASALFAFSLVWIGGRSNYPRDRDDVPPRSMPREDAPTSV